MATKYRPTRRPIVRPKHSGVGPFGTYESGEFPAIEIPDGALGVTLTWEAPIFYVTYLARVVDGG